MTFSDLHNFELPIVRAIQSIRQPWIDQVFYLLNSFDQILTYIIITTLIWKIKGKKIGMHLFYLLILGSIIYIDLKALFAQPRPYELDPSLKIVGTTGYGFPSGASLSAFICFGFLFFLTDWKKPFFRWLGAIAILLVGLTRIYLGAHFLSDVLVGYILGAAILLTYKAMINKISYWLDHYSKLIQFLISGSFIWVLLSIYVTRESLMAVIVLTGGMAGYFFVRSKKDKTTQLFPILLALGGVILLYGGLKLVYERFFTIIRAHSVLKVALVFSVAFMIGFWQRISDRAIKK